MVLLQSNYDKLHHGDKAPLFKLKGTDGKIHTLDEYKGSKALLVIFICNHCPYVKAKIDTINRIAKDFRAKGLAVVGINPNDPNTYPDDSFENMKKWDREKGFGFHYLVDETQETAKDYGAVCTPDPFLFDKDFRLAYHGRIDDGHGPNAAVTSHELRDAIGQLLTQGKVLVKEHPSMGCSIKWKTTR